MFLSPPESRPDGKLGFTEFGVAGRRLGRHHVAAFSANVRWLATRQPREEEEEEEEGDGDEMEKERETAHQQSAALSEIGWW